MTRYVFTSYGKPYSLLTRYCLQIITDTTNVRDRIVLGAPTGAGCELFQLFNNQLAALDEVVEEDQKHKDSIMEVSRLSRKPVDFTHLISLEILPYRMGPRRRPVAYRQASPEI